jgi:hypothetical protein
MSDTPFYVPPAAALTQPEWARVEILGHRRHFGRISEVTRFGVAMLQIEIPRQDDGFDLAFYPASSLFSVALLDEATARRRNAREQGWPISAEPPLYTPALSFDVVPSAPLSKVELF